MVFDIHVVSFVSWFSLVVGMKLGPFLMISNIHGLSLVVFVKSCTIFLTALSSLCIVSILACSLYLPNILANLFVSLLLNLYMPFPLLMTLSY